MVTLDIGECSSVSESIGTVNPGEQEQLEEQQELGLNNQETTDLDGKHEESTHQKEELKAALPLRNKGMKLGYVAPTIKQGTPTACLDKSEIEKENLKWKKAIILYVIGNSPTITYLTNFLRNQCLIERPFDIYYHNEDYFVVRFENMEDKDKMVFEGPYTIANRPVIIKEWEMNFSFEKEILREIPLWIQLPNLPLNCWSGDSLSRIGSVIGTPICADESTSLQKRISYARLLVEVDVTQPLKYAVKVEGEDGQIVEQKIYYEWVPQFCQQCQKVGHTCREIKEKKVAAIPQKKWLRKEQGPDDEKGKEKQQGSVMNNEQRAWSLPKKTATPTIQVGNLHIPTTNVYQAMQELEEGRAETKGGDLIPLTQS